MKNLILGTAQWGSNYGRTNSTGRMSDVELDALLKRVSTVKIDCLDSAPSYGDAESRIARRKLGLKIQTKISITQATRSDLEIAFTESCRRLNRTSVDALLVHDWHLASDKSRALGARFMEELRDRGLVNRVGVSAYDTRDIEKAISDFPLLDVIQVPTNAVDQRLIGVPAIEYLRTQGVVVQARSIFLQGVLIRPDRAAALGIHPDVQRWATAYPLSADERLRACLDYIKSLDWVEEVVVAVSNFREFETLWQSWNSLPETRDWTSFSSSDLKLIDPRTWPAT